MPPVVTPGETSGYASKAFLGVSAAPSPHSGPASASPSLHTIRSERVQGGDNEGGDAGEVEESPEKDNFGPTTLMGRLKVWRSSPVPAHRLLLTVFEQAGSRGGHHRDGASLRSAGGGSAAE